MLSNDLNIWGGLPFDLLIHQARFEIATVNLV
jgi:hypothetical protein